MRFQDFIYEYLRFFILDSKIIFEKKGNVKKRETHFYHEADQSAQ